MSSTSSASLTALSDSGRVLAAQEVLRSDLHPSVPEDLAARLDSELRALNEAVAAGIDVVNDHRDRNLAG